MRLWSLHPQYLDPQGLVALWREALLARAVLRGDTRGYTRHPQLERFRAHPRPRLAINAYLAAVHDEAARRGYDFDRAKVGPVRAVPPIAVGTGQLAYEWAHLQRKLAMRSPAVLARWHGLAAPACHPLFRPRPGPVAAWERPHPAPAPASPGSTPPHSEGHGRSRPQ
ncbi:pyrimidine dimer DNA glycosylase/endonuclease V [Vulcaniibacterium tengchongense]|uniref:Pyrimidine dimer DNA glycosylase /DNA-(Apurinic or apyrimidinic site) lyase n=1 Tax=Vulcaniibacterium tengchongense TaxID=1273429 RepID=A0A3N4VCY7_9GAMM|nr:pyrimidine dimer DNA glycosylase/endonuclease V [Vulcaniibacterium tengchongense]RPE79673.1 pyrimidine dimer DNA glycosylase /DNA-(apurinic or apyrimidinic site) lyase [Vulcaniibacterium tengchongense]